jgi:HK97 family phage major capsid protein
MTSLELARRSSALSAPKALTHTTQLLKPVENTGPFPDFSEQLSAIRSAAHNEINGRPPDARLVELSRRAAAGASEAVPSGGGFLVQPSFSAEIVRRAYLTGNIFQRCLHFPVTAPHANGVKFPQFSEVSRATGSRLGGIQSYWLNEADTITSSKPKVAVNELILQKLSCLVYLTDELLADTNSPGLGEWVSYACGQELMFRTEAAVVAGTGVGQPLGILNSGALITIPAEDGQQSGTIVSANVEKAMNAFWSGSWESEGACWIYNQGLLSNLSSLQLVVGVAGGQSNLWQWASATNQPDMLGGFAAIMSEAASIPGQPCDLLLADFSRYALALKEIQNTISLHIAFLVDSACFKATWRINGAPVDIQPVIPYLGSQPTSPFVWIAAR